MREIIFIWLYKRGQKKVFERQLQRWKWLQQPGNTHSRNVVHWYKKSNLMGITASHQASSQCLTKLLLKTVRGREESKISESGSRFCSLCLQRWIVSSVQLLSVSSECRMNTPIPFNRTWLCSTFPGHCNEPAPSRSSYNSSAFHSNPSQSQQRTKVPHEILFCAALKMLWKAKALICCLHPSPLPSWRGRAAPSPAAGCYATCVRWIMSFTWGARQRSGQCKCRYQIYSLLKEDVSGQFKTKNGSSHQMSTWHQGLQCKSSQNVVQFRQNCQHRSVHGAAAID